MANSGGQLRGRVAVVTGASSGIGAEVSRQLAARGCDLVLAARRLDRLEALAQELRDEHSIEATAIAADLSTRAGALSLSEKTSELGVSILVNNAGFGDFHRFDEVDADRMLSMIELNVTTLALLSHHFAGRFRNRDERCYILNVGSMVAWMPISHFATYCGTKSFVRNFSEALAAELKSTNVSVTCLSPGGTRTEFVEVAGQDLPGFADKSLMSAERCAKIGVKAMLKRKRQVVPGFSNKLVCFLTRFLPRRAVGAAARSVMGDVRPATLDSAAAAE